MTVSTCPYCGVGVTEPGEALACPACSIVFHSECWHQNMGCATYGCKHVGCLKPPPERIMVPGVMPQSTLYRPPERRRPKPKKNFLEDTPPWHGALLGICALSIVPTLFFGIWAMHLLILIVAFCLVAASKEKVVLLLVCLSSCWNCVMGALFGMFS